MKSLMSAFLVLALAALAPAQETLFVDVTEQVGLAGGGAAAWADYDGDGWVDVYISGRLYRNIEGERFALANEEAGLPTDRGPGIWGDFDNDGHPDLFMWGGTGSLFRNNGDGTFTDATAGLPELPPLVSRGAVWVDLDGDGYLDLYIGGYEVWEKEMYPDFILLNQGDGTFREHWRTPPDELLSARGVTAADFNENGRMDVYVSNYRLQPNLLWRNDGEMRLVDVAAEVGVAGIAKSEITYMGGRRYPVCGHTIGSAWGDLDNDGHLDLFVGNFSHPPAYQDRPMFLRNTGPPDFHFEDRSAGAGLAWQESFASPTMGDFDNDGNLDLYFTTVYAGDHSVLYRNEGDWRFADVTAAAGIVAERTYQAAWADYNNNGRLDLLTGGKLYENRTEGGDWLLVRVEGPGSGIGAQARIRLGDRVLTRQVEGATGEGNQNDLRMHFGLGDHEGEVEVELRRTDGTREVFSTPVNRILTVR